MDSFWDEREVNRKKGMTPRGGGLVSTSAVLGQGPNTKHNTPGAELL